MLGKGCPFCYGYILHPDEIQARIADRGLTLLRGYVNTTEKAVFGCEHGHEWLAKPDNVIRGSGCPHCAWSSRFNTPPPLATPTIINAVKLAIGLAVGKCVDLDEAHEAEKLIREFVREHGETRYRGLREEVAGTIPAPDMGALQLTLELVNVRLQEKGFTPTEPLKNREDKAIFTCSAGHTFKSTLLDAQQGRGCRDCRREQRQAGRVKVRRIEKSKVKKPKQQSVKSKVEKRHRINPMEQPCIEWKPQRPYRR
ncbi:zinc-ribbon domain-containing protein [Enterobacter roggenkampii]|uniref:zinc-ribbon domain-containing protein n=1 Tax=Enterobacter roggenkampii TaxID=1812935 RepID=UPI003EB83D56